MIIKILITCTFQANSGSNFKKDERINFLSTAIIVQIKCVQLNENILKQLVSYTVIAITHALKSYAFVWI